MPVESVALSPDKRRGETWLAVHGVSNSSHTDLVNQAVDSFEIVVTAFREPLELAAGGRARRCRGLVYVGLKFVHGPSVPRTGETHAAKSKHKVSLGVARLADTRSSRDNGGVFEIVLHQPQIPPNTGNIMRLCANTGARLHLVKPLGFELSDAKLRRAGLDYRDLARVEIHESWEALRRSLADGVGSWYSLSTSGRMIYSEASFAAGDVLVFGCEQHGLPPSVLDEFDAAHALRVPMVPGSRSLNLANTVAVVSYEAWRQTEFRGSVDTG